MRIPYVPNPPPTTTPEEAEIVSRIQARRAPRPLQPLDRALLHSPPLADGWNAFLGAVRTRGILSPLIRELAISRVAVCNSAWYEWDHHAPLAAEAGLGPHAMDIVKRDDLGAVGADERAAAEADGLREAEWAVLRYTDEMTRRVQVSDDTFAALRRVFDERAVVEITLTVSSPRVPLEKIRWIGEKGEKGGTIKVLCINCSTPGRFL
ncbi:AhpD-like protein [Xylaria intraflava]|nr:AhpD-like protein [Xylaria intraflava]